MKPLIICSIAFISAVAFVKRPVQDGGQKADPSWTNLADVRTGKWPINLQQSGSSYYLVFRDQQVMNEEVSDTVTFSDKGQLKYFQQALSALKTASNGETANFKDYSVKRADRKPDGTWYILRHKWSLTDFKQSEADIIVKTVQGL